MYFNMIEIKDDPDKYINYNALIYVGYRMDAIRKTAEDLDKRFRPRKGLMRFRLFRRIRKCDRDMERLNELIHRLVADLASVGVTPDTWS